MEINTAAPAVARGEIEVAASPAIVWRVLTEIVNWPSWNPDVKSATLEGPLAPGTQFRCLDDLHQLVQAGSRRLLWR